MKLKLTIDGKLYEVDVEPVENEPSRPSYVPSAAVPPRETKLSAAPTSPGGGRVVAEEKVCRSPIAGVVIRVSAQAGQRIRPSDVLLVVEAMKMETAITSPIDGKIAAVNVGVGDSVQARQVLIEFE